MKEFAVLEIILNETGAQSDQDLNKLRRITSKSNHLTIKDGEGERSKVYKKSLSIPAPGLVRPASPVTPTSARNNAWRSPFHPGCSLATKGIGAEKFDKLQPNSPTIYDCYLVSRFESEISLFSCLVVLYCEYLNPRPICGPFMLLLLYGSLGFSGF